MNLLLNELNWIYRLLRNCGSCVKHFIFELDGFTQSGVNTSDAWFLENGTHLLTFP